MHIVIEDEIYFLGGIHMNKVMELGNEHLIKAYNRFPIVLDKGEGMYLYDDNGKKYLDFGSGIGVCALGYDNKDYKAALKEQIDKLMHTSNLFYSKPIIEAAEKFIKVSDMDKVFFTNSGTEAIEGAIKLARKYYFKKTGKAAGEIIAMNHSFHGRSMGSLAVTGQPKYQEAFGPMIPNIKFADFNDLESVKAQISEATCGILLETVQGEGGLYPATPEFIKGVRKLCDDNDILLILDEIQCGMGRSGKMFAYQTFGITPDVMASAKALGCGVPVGLFAAKGKAANVIEPGDHGTTYGGNPFVGATINAVLDIFEKDSILDNVVEVSAYLESKLDELVKKYDYMVERRGLGLMQGIEISKAPIDYVVKAQEQGVIILSAGKNVLRFLPPLIVSKENVDEMIEKLEKCL